MQEEILIAENNQHTLRTTTRVFASKGFEPIPARNLQEARQFAYEMNERLAAIVLDNRLNNDSDVRDRSGVELAYELRSKGVTHPIVIYTTFIDSRGHAMGVPSPSINGDPVDFPTVSKRDGPIKLVETVSKEISLYRSSATSVVEVVARPEPPVVVFGARSRTTAQLMKELQNWELKTSLHTDLAALRNAAAGLRAALFAVFLDGRKHAESIEAIRFLGKFRKTSGRPFYIAAFGAREGSRRQADEAGADITVRRVSADVDAGELAIRMSQLNVMMDKAEGEERQARHALQLYKDLGRQLTALKEAPRSGMSTPLDIVEHAMGWPFLRPGEKLVLSSLYTRMLAAEGDGADAETLDLCVQGADLLARNRASGVDVQAWADRVRRHPSDFTLSWLDEEFYDDDGGEESDEEERG